MSFSISLYSFQDILKLDEFCFSRYFTISLTAIERQAGPVLGIVKDFHFRSMKEKIGPLLSFMPPANCYSQYSIKVDASGIQETLKAIESKWAWFDPEHPFLYSFF